MAHEFIISERGRERKEGFLVTWPIDFLWLSGLCAARATWPMLRFSINVCKMFPLLETANYYIFNVWKKNRKLQLVSKEAFCWRKNRGEYFLRKRVIEWWWDLNHKYSLFLRIRRYILFPGNTLTCSDPGGAAELVSSGFCFSFFLFTLPPTHSVSHLVGFFYRRLNSLCWVSFEPSQLCWEKAEEGGKMDTNRCGGRTRISKTKLEETDDELLPCMYLYDDDEEREIMLSVASFHVSPQMIAFLCRQQRDNERGYKMAPEL